jgi:hypothetical protein
MDDNINIKGKDEKLSDILPQRDYKKLYGSVAFYIFAETEKIENVKLKFVEYFNNDEVFD